MAADSWKKIGIPLDVIVGADKASVDRTAREIREKLKQISPNLRLNVGTSYGGAQVFAKGKISADKLAQAQKLVQTGFSQIASSAQQAIAPVERMEKGLKRNALTMAMFAVGWQIAYGSINLVKQAMSDMINISANFEESLARIRIVTIGVTGDYAALGKEILDISSEFGMSAKEAAEGTMLWAQQGRSLVESLELTRIAAIGVNITGLSMITVVEGMSSVMRAFSIGASSSIGILDRLVQVANVTDIGMGDLLEGIKRVGSTANIVGITLDELSAMIGTIANTTHQAAGEIGNALRTIFMREGRAEVREFVNNIVGVPVYLDKMGNSTRYVTGRMRSFTDILRDVASKFQGMSTENRLMLVDQLAAIRQGDKLIALLKNWTTFEDILTKSHKSEGLALKSNEIIMGLFNKQLAILRAEYEKVMVAIGESAVLPFLTQVVHGLQSFIQWIEIAIKALGRFSEILLLIIPTLGAALAVWGGPIAWIGYFVVAMSGLAFAFSKVGAAASKAAKDMRVFEMQVNSMSIRTTRNELSKVKKELDSIQSDLKARFANLENIDKTGAIRDALRIKAELPEKSIGETKTELAAKSMEEIKLLQSKSAILTKHLKTLIKEDHKRRQLIKAAQEQADNEDRLADIKKTQEESMRHSLEMDKIQGKSALELKILEYQYYLQTNDAFTNRIKKQQYLNEINEEYTKELYAQADAYKQIVSEGINKIIEGTATLKDLGADLLASARKSIIEDVTGLFGEQTGIFNLMSSATKSPIAQAHLNGITAGSKMIVNAHIAGIRAGMSGQSNAQALANMASGGTFTGYTSAPSISYAGTGGAGGGGGGNNMLAGAFGGAAWTGGLGGMKSGASSSYRPGQKGPNAGTYGAKNWMGGAALGGAITGYSQYSAMQSAGASQMSSIAGGLMTGIGTMALMAPDPTGMTQLGGAVLLLGGLIISSMSGKKGETKTDVREQTQQITSRINVSNKQLELVNRNLVALRKGFEGWIMQESYYLRSRSRSGVNVQSEFALNMRRGNQ